MSDKNTSTLQSYIDSASGAVQSALGSISGSASDQVFHFNLFSLSHYLRSANNEIERRRGQERQGST
jgi:hypothetical protein